MKRNPFFVLLVLVLGHVQLLAQESLWPKVEKEMKPWTRWWWMGSAVDEHNIKRLLNEYEQEGFGGVEIAPIYGAKGFEGRFIEHLSPKWMDKLRFAVHVADSMGMGVDLTNGTGWPFGGPHITSEEAASRLLVGKYQVKENQYLSEKILSPDDKQPKAKLLSVTAYSDRGKTLLLTDLVDATGKLNWKAEKGTWELYALFLGKTGQKVKRPAPGGAGYTLDHFSSSALASYLKPFDLAIGDSKLGIRSFYNDSYEVYGADWTGVFFDFFRKMRGYDLRLYVRDLLSDEKQERVARIKSDYRETMSELLLENFTKPWTSWAHGHQAWTKNQAHGSPGNLLDLYAAVDIPEVETFGSSHFPIAGLRRDSADVRNVDPDPMMLKFASSSANVTGKKLVSCETFTWLSEHFKTSWSQCKPEVEQVFLAGINHVFYHGITYSPEDVPWPGWLFYASVNFVPANSLWSHLQGLNSYITRVQSVLQSTKADNELLVYWPIYDVWDNPKGRDMPLKVHDIDEWLHPTAFYKNALKLQGEGYSFDFVSDHLLSQMAVEQGRWQTADGQDLPYKVLIVPKMDKMPVQTMQGLIRLARAGATILFQALPQDVPGFYQSDKKRSELQGLIRSMGLGKSAEGVKVGKGKMAVAADLVPALVREELVGEELARNKLKFIRRRAGKELYYYIVNHHAAAVDSYVTFGAEPGHVYVMDPLTGAIGKAKASTGNGQQAFRLQLASGEACVLKISPRDDTGTKPWFYLDNQKGEIALNGSWTLTFSEGGPRIPSPKTMARPAPWTDLQDSVATSFSGKGTYKLSFELPEINAKEYVLQLDKLYESAKVKINGRDAGQIWSLPYRLRIGDYLLPGKNEIEIEVANLMANRIIDLDKKGVKWNEYHDSPLVNINYGKFDAKGWTPTASGLEGKVTIAFFD